MIWRSSAVMYRNNRWWPIQNRPITRKLMAKLRILSRDSESSWLALITAWGTRMSTTSRVMAMAKTASLKNSARRARCAVPSAPIGGSAAVADGSPPSVIASRTFHP